jgi:hypothetical protein
MARAKKIMKIQFADGERELPSSYTVKCSISDNTRKFYTPKMVELIKRKYNNNFQEFIDNFVVRGYTKRGEPQRETPVSVEEIEDDLTPYKNHLKLEYRFLKTKGTMTALNKAEFIKETFYKRFPDEDIKNVAELL